MRAVAAADRAPARHGLRVAMAEAVLAAGAPTLKPSEKAKTAFMVSAAVVAAVDNIAAPAEWAAMAATAL